MLKSRGKTVQVICSTGIACDVYEPGIAKTVHSFFALQTGELSSDLLLERSLKRADVVERVKATDVLIWDEISMSSSRMLEVVNLLCSRITGKKNPLGGIQTILVGDFFQLKPVPGIHDPGYLMFTSDVFSLAFEHRFELT